MFLPGRAAPDRYSFSGWHCVVRANEEERCINEIGFGMAHECFRDLAATAERFSAIHVLRPPTFCDMTATVRQKARLPVWVKTGSISACAACPLHPYDRTSLT